jgi:hypothetical protein
VTINVTNIELVNQPPISAFGVTVSCSAASKYVGSIGMSLSSGYDTPPAPRRRIGTSKSKYWRVSTHESNAYEDMQAVL